MSSVAVRHNGRGRPIGQIATNGRSQWPARSLRPERWQRDLAVVAERTTNELQASPFPLSHMRCENNGDRLILSGSAARYYYVQLALEIIIREAAGNPIEIAVHVNSTAAVVRCEIPGSNSRT
jgi:hypothetical protein